MNLYLGIILFRSLDCATVGFGLRESMNISTTVGMLCRLVKLVCVGAHMTSHVWQSYNAIGLWGCAHDFSSSNVWQSCSEIGLWGCAYDFACMAIIT